MSPSQTLASTSIVAGAAAMSLATVANAALLIFDHTASPITTTQNNELLQ